MDFKLPQLMVLRAAMRAAIDCGRMDMTPAVTKTLDMLHEAINASVKKSKSAK